MTKLENRCANCGGKFGLICHHHRGLRFCRQACKENFLAKTAEDFARLRKWFGLSCSAGKSWPRGDDPRSIRQIGRRKSDHETSFCSGVSGIAGSISVLHVEARRGAGPTSKHSA